MIKRRSTKSAICTLALSSFFSIIPNTLQAADISRVLLEDSNYSLNNTHIGYLSKLNREADTKAMLEVINSAQESYSYFTPTDDGVRARRGPGVDFRINYSTYKNEPEVAEFPGDFPMSVLGGIVGNTVYVGDENCSKWQEILAVNAGSYKAQGLDLMQSIGNSGEVPSYICSDFIQTESVEPYLDEFFDITFGIDKISNEYIFDKTVIVNKTITFPGIYPAFVENTLNNGDKVAFSSDFYDGMSDEEVNIYKMLDDKYAIEIGVLQVENIKTALQLDENGVKVLESFIGENERLQ